LAAAAAVLAAAGDLLTIALMGDAPAGLLLTVPFASSSCLGANRDGRTDVLDLTDRVGLLPTLAPAAPAVLPTPAACPAALLSLIADSSEEV
jgi:hypothetical protein